MTAPPSQCRVYSVEFGSREVVEGGSLRIGRHPSNDLVLPNKQVSRFHARITWDQGRDRPVLFDNGSQNGTTIDAKYVDGPQLLHNGAKIQIGHFILTIGLDAPSAALLKDDTSGAFTLLGDDSEESRGVFSPEHTTTHLLKSMELDRSTGTLVLQLPAGSARVTYSLGRIMWIQMNRLSGTPVLEQVLDITGGEYFFERAFQPVEKSLDMWISDYLRFRSRRDDVSTVHNFATRPIRRRKR